MRKIPDRRAPVPPPRDRGKPERELGDSAGQVVFPGTRIRSQRQEGSSFAARFGRVILQNGIAAIPSALYHYQGRLGLSAQQVWFISYVLSHKWDEDLPYPSLKKMAKVTGFSLSQLQRIKNSLCEMGVLNVYPRFNERLPQLPLGLEPVVDVAHGDVGASGDVGQRGVGEARAASHRVGGGDQLGALVSPGHEV